MVQIAAIVPMRHHSQRVPEKNFRLVGGKPLYHHILTTLSQVSELAGIYVDTDSPVIREGIQEFFPAVNVIDRPEELRADEVSMNRIIAHDMSLIQADLYLQTHSTNPLLKNETLSRAIRVYLDHQQEYDSLFSVTRLQTRLYDQTGIAINHNPEELLQTQDLQPIYEENSCIYLFTKAGLAKSGHRIGSAPYLFEIASEEAWDIDDLLDFDIVDYLLRKRNE
ncbi:MAG: acylneuraminate cytidylyltransferase family protein [Anaerolineales bacterium]|nr:MAG: acylneuraminate cytidylyltransferase family protein [Anaerolineales bacterium]